MNSITTKAVSIPFSRGLSLVCEPGYEERLRVALANIHHIVDAIHRLENSPLLAEFIDTVLDRFLRETDYGAKSQHMLKSRVAKLKSVLTSDNPMRRVAELNQVDIQNLKTRLPELLKQNTCSASQGANLDAYYRLFNRIIDEALEDNLLGEASKIATTSTKQSAPTKPFLDANLGSLFANWPYAVYPTGFKGTILEDAHPYRFWLMPLGLFTGARLNELCQLRVHDVIKDFYGVDLISINDNGFKKSLKNEQSRREIPISSRLVEMGFLEFVEERRSAGGNDALIFGELIFDEKHLYSRDPSRFFCGPRTGEGFIGKYCPHTSAGGWNFKSFRRTFSIRLQRSGVPASTIAYLLGHEGGVPEVTQQHYLEKPLSLHLLHVLEQGLSYNTQLDNVHWQHFKNLMASQAGRSKRGRRPSLQARQ
ncbi:Phage integrase family protein [compost metagenome]